MELHRSKWIWLGPLLVILGAGLWGTETFFRVNLNTKFDGEILVFWEQWFCFILTIPFILLDWKKLKSIPRAGWIYVILSGSLGSAIGTTFFTLALGVMNASVANILLNFQPVVSIVFAKILLGEKLGKGFFGWAAFALVLGAAIASSDLNFAEFKWTIGLLYVSITAITWGFSTVAGRGTMLHMPLGAAVGIRFFVGALTMVAMLGLKGKLGGEFLKVEQFNDWFVVKNYLWLATAAGVFPTFLYFKGLSKTSASVGCFCELTQTFAALVLTWGVMGQPLTLVQVVAGLLLVFAVYMINLNFSRANKQLYQEA